MIGREKEQAELLRRYQRNKAEFVAVYGRRRVGKTTLVNETFQEQFAFRHAGLSPAEKQGALAAQLQHFYHSLLESLLHYSCVMSSCLCIQIFRLTASRGQMLQTKMKEFRYLLSFEHKRF